MSGNPSTNLDVCVGVENTGVRTDTPMNMSIPLNNEKAETDTPIESLEMEVCHSPNFTILEFDVKILC